MNLVIDKFTPCLEDSATGELAPTIYERASKKDLSQLEGWNFDWQSEDLVNSEIYELCLVGDKIIQGLIAVTDFKKDMAVYINIAESAPHKSWQKQEVQRSWRAFICNSSTYIIKQRIRRLFVYGCKECRACKTLYCSAN